MPGSSGVPMSNTTNVTQLCQDYDLLSNTYHVPENDRLERYLRPSDGRLVALRSQSGNGIGEVKIRV